MVSYLSSLFDLTVCKHRNQMIPWTAFDLVGKIEKETRWNICQSFAVIFVLIPCSWRRHRNSRKQSKFLSTIFFHSGQDFELHFWNSPLRFFGIICVFTFLHIWKIYWQNPTVPLFGKFIMMNDCALSCLSFIYYDFSDSGKDLSETGLLVWRGEIVS